MTAPNPATTEPSDDIQALIARYYSVFNARTGNLADLHAVVADGWINHGSAGTDVNAAAFSGLLAGIHQSVPDLSWRVVETIVAGGRVVVRGEGTGTPIAPLFGTAPTGVGFRILSIDIHTIADGRIRESYHLEDWATALGQIAAGEPGSPRSERPGQSAARGGGTDGASTRWMLRATSATNRPDSGA